MNKTINNENNGFIVLITAIIISIVLASGIGIIKLAVREIRLSRVSTESLKAFNNVDIVLECAKFHDFQTTDFPFPNFSTTSPPVFPYNESEWTPLCTNISEVSTISAGNCNEIGGSRICTYTFDASLDFNPGCAQVTVLKTIDMTSYDSAPAGFYSGDTRITAQGRSNCTSGKAITRIIQYQYKSFLK